MSDDWKKFDYETLMTCPFKIHDRSQGPDRPLFVIEPIMNEICVRDAEKTPQDVQFFQAYSLEHARHIVKREWFKKLHKEITENAKRKISSD